MRRILFLVALLLPFYAHAESWQQALTLFGTPKYATNFKHFDYVNPTAPKGGTAKMASPSSFDSLNPFIMKGVKAPGLKMLYDSLMVASLDEPQTYYPLIAKRFRLAEDKSWMEFELNPKAKWHDGKPITPEDVIWTLETLKLKADPVYRITYQPLEKATKTGEHSVRIDFAENAHREVPILAASMTILPKHYYTEVEFEKTTLIPPLGSGPYKIDTVDVGRSITYKRHDDYWGQKLPVNLGQYNISKLRYDVYRDATVQLEALKAGEFDIHREYISRNWATAYNTPAVQEGRLIKTEIPDHSPQGMQAFFFNLRQPHLQSPALREAVALTMDFEWTNKQLFYGAYARNSSFFQKTPFAATELPNKAELTLLEPFKEGLPAEVFTEIPALPTSDGTGQNRTNLLQAQTLLDEAGFTLKDGKRINPINGKPLEIEFMLSQPTMQRVIMPMLRGLKKLGIEGRVRLVDDAQYQRRIETRDFDIISNWINLGVIFPGIEQFNYWHSSQATVEGSNNITGMSSAAVDAMVKAINNARTLEDLTPAARALDRILLSNHTVIPHWHSGSFRMAFWDKFGRPKLLPKYGLGFDTWWIKQE